MLKANERRQKILEILCVRRQETMENLAQEFNVTTRTIRNDIEELTLAHPIETVRGRYGGGVRVADGYYLGRMLKFLTGDLWKITLSSRAWQFNNLEEVREKSNKYHGNSKESI